MRRVVLSSPFAALAAGASGCVGSSSSSSFLNSTAASSQLRGYKHMIKPDFVPEGAVTSRFQSSNVPSERRAVLQEYAVAPLFGARVSCLVIGSTATPKQFLQHKKKLAAVIDEILDLKEGTVMLGETRWLSDSTFPQPLSPQFRRLDPKTGETLANCLVGVHLPSEMDLIDQLELGVKLSDAILGSNPDPRLTVDLDVTYCEFEVPDLNHYEPDMLMGEAVDPDAAAAALDRWMDRIQDQLAMWESMRGDEDLLRGGRQ